jgi:hypothetical protein
LGLAKPVKHDIIENIVSASLDELGNLKEETQMETMDDVNSLSGVPRCVVCNKLYKKTEANEHGLCPKCLAEKTETGNTGVAEVVGEGEQPKKPDAILQGDVQLINPVDTGDESAQPEDKGNESRLNEAQLVAEKPAQAIRDRFQRMNNDGKITPAVLSILTDTEATKRELGIRYAFLKEFNPDTSIKELTYVGGHARYSSKPVEISHRQYLITNDLYKKNVEKFMEWSKLFY